METAICLLSCQDKKGIVASVTGFLAENDGNIVHIEQHIDHELGTLFMRVEWALDDFKIERGKIEDAFKPIAERFNMSYHVHFSDEKERLAIFVSKFNHCLYDILLRVKSGEFHCEVPLIISDYEDAHEIASMYGIPFYCLQKNNDNREEVEDRELALLKEYKIDTVILARYMKIFSAKVIEHYPNRIINIHHSFLPAFIGGSPYKQAYARGVKIIGATSHYVTADLDCGPIIEQDTVRISHSDAVSDLVRKGRDLERIVLARAVGRHLDKKILTYANKTVVFE